MVLGIIISVAALTVTFSIFEGYQRVLKSTLLSTNSHIYIFSSSSEGLADTDILQLNKYLNKQKEVAAFAPAVMEQAMITKGSRNDNGKVISCQIRGINWQEEFLPIRYREYIETGTWKLINDNDIVIGKELAKKLNVKLGDMVYLVSPAQSKMTIMGLQSQSHAYHIAGLYHSGIFESDSRSIFMSYDQAWTFSRNPGEYSRMEVKLNTKEIDRADYLSYIWENDLLLNFHISCWQDFNSSLFNLLELEKWVLFFILSFLVVVASFNVVSTVSSAIIERKHDIGIMRAYGFSRRSLHSILLGRILGIGFLAILTGVFTGMFLSWLASVQNFFQIKGDVYFLDRISVYFSPFGLAMIVVTAFIIILIAALIPLRDINRLNISEILRS